MTRVTSSSGPPGIPVCAGSISQARTPTEKTLSLLQDAAAGRLRPPDGAGNEVDERRVEERDEQLQQVLADDQREDDAGLRGDPADAGVLRQHPEGDADEDDGVDGLAGTRRNDVAEPQPAAVGVVRQRVEDDDVVVLADDVRQQAAGDDVGRRRQRRLERRGELRVRRRRGDGAVHQRQYEEVHQKADVDENLCGPAAVQLGVAVRRQEGQCVGQRRPREHEFRTRHR